MKTQLLPFILFFCFIAMNAQFAPAIEISGISSLYPAAVDINGDGYIDIFYNSVDVDGKIVWRENIDGQATFGPERIIDEGIAGRVFIFMADLDGDGDLDLLAGSEDDDTVSWYENLDGLGNFGPRQVIATDVVNVSMVHAADIDGDGHLDVLAVSHDNNFVSLYTNLDGLGNFGSGQIISSELDQPYGISTGDLDGDGDIDVIVTSWRGDTVIWFENTDGQGTFGPKKILSQRPSYNTIVGDIDGDGNLDLLVMSTAYGILSWYKNLDGLGNFSSEIIIDDSEWLNIKTAELVDIDRDGDLDMVVISRFGEVSWYENLDGQGTFGPEQLIAEVPWYGGDIIAADFNGDNYLDLLVSTGENLLYFENLRELGVSNFETNSISVYPNPVKNILNIDVQNNSEVKSVKIFDVLGKRLVDLKGNIRQFDTSNLSSGIFLLKIETENGIFTKKIIKE